jgi:hypothetical protein
MLNILAEALLLVVGQSPNRPLPAHQDKGRTADRPAAYPASGRWGA